MNHQVSQDFVDMVQDEGIQIHGQIRLTDLFIEFLQWWKWIVRECNFANARGRCSEETTPYSPFMLQHSFLFLKSSLVKLGGKRVAHTHTQEGRVKQKPNEGFIFVRIALWLVSFGKIFVSTFCTKVEGPSSRPIFIFLLTTKNTHTHTTKKTWHQWALVSTGFSNLSCLLFCILLLKNRRATKVASRGHVFPLLPVARNPPKKQIEKKSFSELT